MKILILGAGRVGESVAESLVSERNDITVVDTDPARLRTLQDRLYLRGVVGNGIQPPVLREAGIEDTDMLISCAPMAETNLVACTAPHDLFNLPTPISRPPSGNRLCRTAPRPPPPRTPSPPRRPRRGCTQPRSPATGPRRCANR